MRATERGWGGSLRSRTGARVAASPLRTRGRSSIVRAMAESDLPELLEASRRGDTEAFGLAYGQVYEELRRLARWQRRRGLAGTTLSTTALVHEAYLKLAGATRLAPVDQRHLVALGARAMRQILVDAARARATEKRGSGLAPVTLDPELLAVSELAEDLLALDQALERLAAHDEKLARLVEWRYFGGMTDREIAEELGRDERTIRTYWAKARAFLLEELAGESLPEPRE